MKCTKSALALSILSCLCMASASANAAVNGYGEETPTAETSGNNYDHNNSNPWLDQDHSSFSNPYNPEDNTTNVMENIGYVISQYRDAHTSWSDEIYAVNYEGNSLFSSDEDKSSISADGLGVNLIFYKNYADKVELSASNHAAMFVDNNSAAGATITNDNAFTVLKNNYTDNALITNKNNGTIIIDGNAANGALIVNENSTAYIYHNESRHSVINNNKGTITALGNILSESEINNSLGSKLIIGNCNTSVCRDESSTVAKNIQMNNKGEIDVSGRIDLSGSVVNNDGLISSIASMDLSSSTIKNNGTIRFLGDVDLADSKVINDGEFTLKDSAVMLTDTNILNLNMFNIDSIKVSGGIFSNLGTLNVSGDNAFSMAIDNFGLINLQENASVDLPDSQFTNERNGIVNINDNVNIIADITNYGAMKLVSDNNIANRSKITGDMDNYGSIYLASNDKTVGNQMTIDGNYTGYQGSKIYMNSLLADDKSPIDHVIITGDTVGESRVYVTDLGGHGAQTVEGLRVIEVQGNSGAEFTQGGRIVAGSYDYFLARGDDNSHSHWYLTSKDNTKPEPEPEPEPEPKPDSASIERPEAGSYIANIAAANTLFSMSQADRSGDTHYRDPLTGKLSTTRMWLRNVGGHNNWKSNGSQLSTQSNRYIVQMGGDVAEWSFSGEDSMNLGIMAGYANSKSTSHSQRSGYNSKGSINGYSTGLYSTWYANAQDKTGLYVDTWALYNWFNNSVKGDGLSEESYKSKGITASVETGYAYKIKDFTDSEGATNSWFVQPQLQLTWMGVKAKDHTESNGTRVQSEGNNNVETRLGVKTYLSGHARIDDGKGRSFQPFIETNWIYNSKTFAVRMDDNSVSQSGARNLGEVKVGVEGVLSSQLNLWGNIGTRLGDNGYNDSTATLGVKYSF